MVNVVCVLVWDHPRMCGEHHINPENVGHGGGIIPACAGSTKISVSYEPRFRGSSPHVRGAPVLV